MYSFSARLAMLLALSFVFTLGCTPQPAVTPPVVEPGGHDHDHPAHGPRNGHLVELGDEQYHAEWILDDEAGVLTVFIMDGSVSEDVPIEADELQLAVKIGDNEAKTYAVKAVKAEGEIRTPTFECRDRQVVEGLKLVGHGVDATLRVSIEGEPFEGPLKGHDHAH